MTFWFSSRIEKEIPSQVPAGAQRCTFSPETASGDEFKATPGWTSRSSWTPAP